MNLRSNEKSGRPNASRRCKRKSVVRQTYALWKMLLMRMKRQATDWEEMHAQHLPE